MPGWTVSKPTDRKADCRPLRDVPSTTAAARSLKPATEHTTPHPRHRLPSGGSVAVLIRQQPTIIEILTNSITTVPLCAAGQKPDSGVVPRSELVLSDVCGVASKSGLRSERAKVEHMFGVHTVTVVPMSDHGGGERLAAKPVVGRDDPRLGPLSLSACSVSGS